MLVNIQDYKEYASFLQSFSDYNLAQSKLWLKAKQNSGDVINAFVWLKDRQPMFLAQVVKQTVMKGRNMLVLPFGPLFNLATNPTSKDLGMFLDSVKRELGASRPIFIQVDPFSFDKQANAEIQNILQGASTLVPSKFPHRHADGTLVIDTTKDPTEELMPNFREDVRYNIKRALREKKLEVIYGNNEPAFREFWVLYKELQARMHFVDDRNKLYKTLLSSEDAVISLARRGNETVAAIFNVLFKEESSVITFLSGTSKRGNKLRAPSLLRWDLFNWAHQHGFQKVDFFAIKSEDGGYTKFKTGFGGEKYWFNVPYDLVVNKMQYKAYSFIKSFKRK